MKFPQYKRLINLIPGGCLQFLDFSLNVEELRRSLRFFREDLSEEAQGTRYPHYLRCLIEEDDRIIDARYSQDTLDPTVAVSVETLAEEYSFTYLQALECFCGSWMPVPFLRMTGQPWPDGISRVAKGPSNWARGIFIPTDEDPDIWHLCLAFDTTVEKLPDAGDGRYFALSRDDLNAASEFLLAWRVRDNSWFVNEPWVNEWLSERYDAGKERAKLRDDGYGKQFCLKHIACYMTWLDAVARATEDIHVKVSDTNRSDAVDVDMILDIGNSRTTGILVETSSAKKTDLNDSYLLELRDLSNPNNISTEPFSTRVEFVDASFGNDMLSRRSGRRTAAFAWPTCVRVGPEATRLSTYASCAEGNTGMSSPKRYLWDETRWTQSWRFNTGGIREPMVTRGLFPRQLNEEGTPLACFTDDGLRRLFSKSVLSTQKNSPLFGSFFTRSSLMMFMFAEIVTQALVNINSPASRAKRQLSDKPRHLRRIILTVPTAMPVASRRIFERWVKLAVHTVWTALGWNNTNQNLSENFHYQSQPEILCEWDEASCSQLVLLYNEIMVKHIGDASQYFQLYGRMRPEGPDGTERPSVRIASIDIGGGTTDLSITTHFLTSDPSESARIMPKMEFRDGFNLAGDEVVRSVIQEVVIHAIEKEMTRLNIEPRNVKLSLFGRYTQAKTEQMRTRQGQFVQQVAIPIALSILEGCEHMDKDDNNIYSCLLGEFFESPASKQAADKSSDSDAEAEAGSAATQASIDAPAHVHYVPITFAQRPQERIMEFVQNVFRDCGAGSDIDINAIPITFSQDLITRCISRTLGGTLSSLCEMVKTYDADLLIITGRPSAWNGVLQTILAMTPLPPARIIPMRHYHVGSWYPCADLYGYISDPKTTVVVGAILCALSCGYLEGINFDSTKLRMTSTARFVGELNLQGQLEEAKVWFTVKEDGSVEPEEQTITYHSPITIGYRQLAVERWPASTYYKLEMKEKTGNGPYSVKVKLNRSDVTGGRAADDSEDQQSEGSIELLEINGPDGIPVNLHRMSATLQTLPTIEGYWLDSGIVISER